MNKNTEKYLMINLTKQKALEIIEQNLPTFCCGTLSTHQEIAFHIVEKLQEYTKDNQSIDNLTIPKVGN